MTAALLSGTPVRVVAGGGALSRLGDLAGETGARRAFVVSDASIQAAGHVGRAVNSLQAAFIDTRLYLDVPQNPTSVAVEAAADSARRFEPDLIVGLGGGSAMDAAKAVNLLLRLGGRIQDHRGDPGFEVLRGRPRLLPMILAPTTAGTGSEAQSFALISDAATHEKMACGDRRLPAEGGLRPIVAILDPWLTWTTPPRVRAATGLDALSHAVETAGCRVATERSLEYSRAAWEKLRTNFQTSLRDPDNEDIRAEMLTGAHLAGCAIELSMLGAAHACANPLTARHELAHGVAVGLMLPHVVAFNTRQRDVYAALGAEPGELRGWVQRALEIAGVSPRLRDHGISRAELPELANLAAGQWTARFNPVQVGEAELRQIYEAAY